MSDLFETWEKIKKQRNRKAFLQKHPYQFVSPSKDTLHFKTPNERILYQKRLTEMGQAKTPSPTEKERAGMRISTQTFGQLPIKGEYPGSPIAEMDSLTIGFKQKPEDYLKSQSQKARYTATLRKLRAQRKAEQEGVESLTDEEGRTLFGSDKWDDFKKNALRNQEKLDKYLNIAKKAGDIATAETEAGSGVAKYPDLFQTAEETTKAYGDSVAMVNVANRWGMDVDRLRSAYDGAKQEIGQVLITSPIIDVQQRAKIAEDIAKKYGFADINQFLEVDDEIELKNVSQ